MMRLSASYAVKIAVVVGEGKEQKKKRSLALRRSG
jgi:hypothetical protein